MLSSTCKNRLLSNWGAPAESMQCYVEVAFIDRAGGFTCYVYAMNPDDQDAIACIIVTTDVELHIWSMTNLLECYNRNGDSLIQDPEFTRIWAAKLYKKLEIR